MYHNKIPFLPDLQHKENRSKKQRQPISYNINLNNIYRKMEEANNYSISRKKLSDRKNIMGENGGNSYFTSPAPDKLSIEGFLL